MIELIIISFCVALVGFTYSVILTDGGMILDFWYIFLQRKVSNEKLFNVLVGCSKCVSGQLALWVFFFTPYFNWWHEFHFEWAIIHLLFIIITIWFSLILNKFHKWLS